MNNFFYFSIMTILVSIVTIGVFALGYITAQYNDAATLQTCKDQLSTAEMSKALNTIAWSKDNSTHIAYGLAQGEYFCVKGNLGIEDTLNVCAHEWAHTHEGLND